MFVDNCFFLYAEHMNYALFRPANQSSTLSNGVAGKAVDGISDDESSISHTLDGDYHPWWKVELAYPIWVTHVEITNRLNWGKKMSKYHSAWTETDMQTVMMNCIYVILMFFHSCESRGVMKAKITHDNIN